MRGPRLVKRTLKPVTITKRQLDNVLVRLFEDEDARLLLSNEVYDYAWTVWASRQRDLKQGERADRMAKRKTVVLP